MTVVNVGVPFLVVLDEYERISQKDDHIITGSADSSSRLDHFVAMVDLLSYWVSSAQSSSFAGGQPNAVRQELSHAMASGRLMPKIDGLKAKLEAIPGTSDVLDRLRLIEESTNYIV